MLVVFKATGQNGLAIPTGATTAGHLQLAKSIRFVQSNAAFWILFAAVFVGAFGSSVGSKALVYYVSYVMAAPEQVPVFLSASLLVTALSIPLWAWAGTRFSKRDVWFIGALGLSVCQGALLISMPQQTPLLFLLICIAAIFNGAFVTMFWAMLPDTVEFGQWRTGVRDEGILFGLNQLALKAASGLGVGALGFALSFIGYTANETQTAETKIGLGWLTFGIPFFGAILTAFIIRQSPLTKHRHTILVKWLERSS
jgi:GPH family glycoside/pentoside/hexuronide:cation symporter